MDNIQEHIKEYKKELQAIHKLIIALEQGIITSKTFCKKALKFYE